MWGKFIVCILVLALLMAPFAADTSVAGGGGCSGEDEGECLTVVFGTAAVIFIGTYILLRQTETNKTEAIEDQINKRETSPLYSYIDLSERNQITTFPLNIDNRIAQNNNIGIRQW